MKFFLETFGCQMNEHDSEIMAGSLRSEGHTAVHRAEEADLVVINTCSIRDKSYHKAVSEIGRMKKNREVPPIVAVTGCVASQEGEALLKRFPHLDIVLGPDHLRKLPGLVSEVAGRRQRFSVTEFEDISDYEFPTPLTSGGRCAVTAFVTIMKGCDNVCSFCIVPRVRGPEVSRPSDDIVAEIRRLEEEGVREILLLGQNVNSYGKHLPDKTTFARLLRRIDEETGIGRLRFISPHPKDLSRALIEEYGRNRKLCPNIHLPVQSGSDRVLKRMRRSYTRQVYRERVRRLREVLPEIAITTDIIVGFPGETEEDFRETVSLVEEIGYASSYLFMFSPRPMTEAAGFADDVPLEVKKERWACLEELQKKISLEKNRRRIGRIEEVLIEGPSVGGDGQLTGRTPEGRIVNFSGDDKWIGAIMKIRIRGASAFSLRGEVDDD